MTKKDYTLFTYTCDRCGRQTEVTEEAVRPRVETGPPEGWRYFADPRVLKDYAWLVYCSEACALLGFDQIVRDEFQPKKPKWTRTDPPSKKRAA